MPLMTIVEICRLTGAALRATICAALALLFFCQPTYATEIRLLSAAALQSVFKDVASDFERTSGHKLNITYATVGGISQRIQSGETADFVIGSNLTMPPLVAGGKITSSSLTAICKTGIGLVVPRGNTKPIVTSVEDFKQALLAAKVLVYADPVRGGAAGVHIAKVLQRLGISEQLKAQITLGAGGDVTEVTIAQGSGALGMTQISEIVDKSTAEYVGPFPAELQNYTVFIGGVPSGSMPSDAITALIAFLKSPTALAAIEAKGMRVD
jgi:molybdate transport system substrate-binding protein